MEIAKITPGSIKIKTKTATLLVDPQASSEADAVLLLSDKGYGDLGGDQLIVEGAGEYETKGVIVKGEGRNETLRYEVIDDSYKIIVTSSEALKSIKDVEELSALVIKVSGKIDEGAIPALASGHVILFGDTESSGLSNIKPTNKLNLKKVDEQLQGFLIGL